MELNLRQSCFSLPVQTLESSDPQLARAVRNLRVLAGAHIDLLGIKRPPEEDYEDDVAYLRVDGELETLWRDWSDHREDIYWLENHDFSGKIVEIARFLSPEVAEEDLHDDFYLKS
jgi:hypothetical protein